MNVDNFPPIVSETSISESDLLAVQDKTNRHLRLREYALGLLFNNYDGVFISIFVCFVSRKIIQIRLGGYDAANATEKYNFRTIVSGVVGVFE